MLKFLSIILLEALPKLTMRLRYSLPYVLLDVYGGCSLKPLQNFIFLIVIKNKFLKFQLVIFFWNL